MKKIMSVIFFVLTFISYSQKSTSNSEQIKPNQINISLSSGISKPSSNFSDNSFASDGSFFELSSAYYFSKFGLGISIGQFSNPTKGDFNEFTNQLGYPVLNSTEDWKTSYYGIGPNVKLDLGNIEATLYARYGQMSTKAISLEGNYSNENADISTTIPVFNLRVPEKTSSGYYNTGLKLGYKISPNFSFYFVANYLTSASDEIEIESRIASFQDLDGDGTISEQEILKLIGSDISYSSTSTITKLSTLNYGFGLSYSFGKRTIKIGGAEKPYARGNADSNNKGNVIKKSINSGSVVFTNPIKERKQKARKIIQKTPKNNASFQDLKELKSFTWSLVGERIMQPKYGVTVEKVNTTRRNVLKTYFETGDIPTVNARSIFKGEPDNGQYRWKVVELTTGTSSNYSYFTFSNCEIDFSISNEEIECLGYEGEDRKYKICFDSTYSSTSGDLTFVNPGSGLSVFDQTYSALTYTMVSPNPTLLTQIGASTTTVSYCFEVTVSASVTSIGFGLQGDDLDPSPVLCQPGVSANFDELPDCICDECEEIELSFDNFNISLNGTSGNQFNFNGNINVNVPIYGIEFQIQSYSYSASPSACSEGVSSVEESGMILMPGTSINGSTTLQLFNETASGSPSSNNNATKDIKYTSNSPLTGGIPVNLTIGLPGPISGLDPSCCLMEYTVCIKVKVFYEESNCKSCVFTHCFTFNNQ